jgi:hypothetical protein
VDSHDRQGLTPRWFWGSLLPSKTPQTILFSIPILLAGAFASIHHSRERRLLKREKYDKNFLTLKEKGEKEKGI